MYSGTNVAGRTRSRKETARKLNFENDNESWKQHMVDEIKSEEECCSGNSKFDDDGDDDDDDGVIIVEEATSIRDEENKKESLRGKKLHEKFLEIVAQLKRSPSGSSDGSNHEAEPRGMGVASRTRSYSRVTKCRNNEAGKFRNTKAGTSDNPIDCDDEEEEEEEKEANKTDTIVSHESSDFSSDEDESPKVSLKRRRKKSDGLKIRPEKIHGEEEVSLISVPSNVEEGNHKVMGKRRKVSQTSLEESESEEDELDKIWDQMNMADGDPEPEEEDGCEEEEGISEETSEPSLSKPLEESESEEDEADQLFAELNEYLYNEKIRNDQLENGHCDEPHPQGELSIAARCERGDHEPIMMDEEIGIVCKHCRHIIRDIKDCDLEFGKYPTGRPRRRYSYYSEDSDDSLSHDSEVENSGQHDKSSGLITYASAGTVWDIIPRARKRMYQHQLEAFEFLWTNLAGGTVLEQLDEKLNFDSGGGCIISHAPGTGKTFLTIVFVKAFMRKYPNCRPMIIAPTSILNTWERELEKWSKVGDPVPFHNLNNPDLSGKETFSATSRMRRRGGGRRGHRSDIRWAKISSWRDATSILGISYNLYDRLARKESNSVKKALFELPGMVVLDEGHTPRNDKSLLWETLSNVKTKRRVILSGTPFQNNFRELHNTLRLANPVATAKKNLELLLKSYYKVESGGEKAEIISGIKGEIKPFVHVHKGTVLQEKLPGLKEAVVTLMPSQTPMLMFDYIQRLRKSTAGSSNWFKFEHLMSVASVHPKLFIKELKKFPERERVASNGLLDKLDLSPEAGIKTKFVLDFIQQSERMKEKVLIFSQYIDPLAFLAKQIKSRFHWREGEQMMIIYGRTQESIRQVSMDAFNDPKSKARVMLASTKTCYEGINLVGASRVILLDTLWNPSAERQAVSRAYRIGQRRIVYTYRLITAGTWDEEKLSIQAEKDQLSELVFSDPAEAGHRQNMSPDGFEDKLLEKMPNFGTTITAKSLT